MAEHIEPTDMIGKRYRKPKAYSTLYNMKKSDLIKYIRCLENSNSAAVWLSKNQARHIESLGLKRMDGE